MMSLGDSTASSLGDVSRKRKCTSDDSAGTYGPLPPEQFYAQKERMKVGRAASEIEPIVVNDKRSVELKASSELKRSAPRNCADSSDSSESSSDVSKPKKSKAKKSKKKMKKKKKKSAKRADKRDSKKAASHVVQLGRRDSSDLDNSAVAGEEVSKKRPSVQKPAPALSSPVNMVQKRVLAPMTREDYERQQSIVRRVLDPETGRSRLVKGDGEILEEIVSYKRHKEINKQATKADGAFFEKKVGIEYPQSSKMTR